MILCDLSANDPNVYLELGWALRADKKIILIKDDLTSVNFDISQFYSFEYSHKLQPSELKYAIVDLTNIIKNTLKDQHRLYSIVNKIGVQMQSIREVKSGNLEVSLLKDILSEIRYLSRKQVDRDEEIIQNISEEYLEKNKIKFETIGKVRSLTAVEINILKLIMKGKTNQEIAEKLSISFNTVKTNIYTLFKKINVTNRLQAVFWVEENLK
jgi:DNA-binding CsgD family transcriptional regulator